MPTITLNPDANGTSANLNVDGRDVLAVSIGANGNVGLTLPAVDFYHPDVFFTRDTHGGTTATNTGVNSDSTDVWADRPGKPRITIPIESGTPASPSPGAHPLIGQDTYLYDVMYALSTRTNTIDLVPQVGDRLTASIATTFSRLVMNVKSAMDAALNVELGSPVMFRYPVPSGVLTVLRDPSIPKTLMSLSKIRTRYWMVPSRSTMVVNGRPVPAVPVNRRPML